METVMTYEMIVAFCEDYLGEDNINLGNAISELCELCDVKDES